MKSFTYDGGMNEGIRIPEGTERLIIASSVTILPMTICQNCADTLQEIVFPPEGECNLRQIDGFWLEAKNKGFSSRSRQMAVGRCTAVKTLRIPSSVEIIGDHAFYLWTGLVEVHLSEGLKAIGANALGICSSLSKIRIPSTVETIGNLAFGNCIKLEEVIFAAESKLKKIDKLVFSCCTWLSDINLPPTVKEIGSEAFHECKHLESIELPKQLTIIGSAVFQRCTRLREVKLHDEIKQIGPAAFNECKSLKSIDLSKQLVFIGLAAFEGCLSLKLVQLHEGLIIMEDYVFSDCRALLRIAIPSTLARLGEFAFAGCSELVEIILPPGRLKCIQKQTFSDCDELQSISIPSTIEIIEEGAFTNCNLKSIELHPGAEIDIEAYSFGRNAQLCNISSEDNPNAKISESALLHDDADGDEDESDFEDDPKFWSIRYRGYPVHNLCYHASTTTVLQLRRAVDLWKSSFRPDNGPGAQIEDRAVDKYGMTPFHILLSAAKRRKDLLDVLLEEYPLYMLGWKDRWGNRPSDGLLGNWNGEAKDMTKMVVQKWMIDGMASWGLPAWKDNISRRLSNLLEAEELSWKLPILNGLCDQFSYFERVEATSLLELWLWKMDLRSSRKEVKRILLDRDSSRNRCGSYFVIPMVVSFLPNVEEVTDEESGKNDDDDLLNESQEDFSDDASDVPEGLYYAKSKRFGFFPSSSDNSSAAGDNIGD
ncbi:unnamed protein product [Cylindrotheca closterium]|uniref:Uncharacterized protein n=1 Tax=Cylindrotheca closterium TaxID=2856 RepID=A0AAD2FMU9_9STRA|nr:unnamed protein product [Cylindrotheca closterium]